MKKINLLTLFLMLLGTAALAQNNFFRAVPPGELSQAGESAKSVGNKSVFRLNEPAMRSYLRNVRLEFKNNGVTLPLEIPLPDGTTEIFNMVESPILSPAIAAQNPDIKTYTGNGTRDKKRIIRISLTSLGFSAIILNVGGDAVYFESYSKQDPTIYFNYFAKDVSVPKGISRNGRGACGEPFFTNSKLPSLPDQVSTGMFARTGNILRTYRIAFAATGEFTGAHGGTQASGLATIVGYVNRMTALYRNELSVSFTLVSGTNLIYTNAATDPYTGDNEVTMLNENQDNLDYEIGDNNYDIGHVFSWNELYGSGGGVASTPSLGVSGRKARGASIEGADPYTQVFFDQLVFHEVGHQFSMTHSYNSNIPVCTSRQQPTSVEPGSGATIMSYGFTCGTDDYTNSTTVGPILKFHTVNYDQAVNYTASIPSVGTATATGNTPPAVIVPTAYTIPKSTPFALTGSATDANGDALTYSWEGTNIGLTTAPDATVLADPSKPPFFRTYEPSPTGTTRVYPLLSAILNGSNYAIGDKLPSVSVATTHRLTVRDNNAAGGGVDYGSVTVTVNGNIGPFLVTSNLSGSFAANATSIVTWSVNGTNTATPNVKISLSTDGGYTFPIVLAASTPNDGSQAVTLPNNPTTTARIKVESVGNIFFDISNSNFTITPGGSVNYTITATAGSNGTITPSGQVTVAQGASKTFTITPNAGYVIDEVKIDKKTSVGAVSSYTFTNVTEDHKIDASFKCPPITLSAVVTNIKCNGELNGAINLTVNNGFAPFTYTWSSKGGYNSSSEDITGLGAGKYSIRVSQANGCKADTSFTVTEPDKLVIKKVTSENVSCFGFNNGLIRLKAQGGTPPYDATIDNNNYYYLNGDSITFYDLAPGTYTPILYDANVCEVTYSPALVITQPAALGATLCYSSNTLTVVGTDGTEPYEYSIDGVNYKKGKGKEKSYDFNVSGAYTVYVKDKNDCIYSTSGYTSSLGSCAGARIASRNIAEPAVTINTSIAPNPSEHEFTLRVTSSNTTQPIQVRVLDMNQRVMYMSQGAVKGAYRFGENFRPATYVVEITQGNEKRTLKIIKL